MIRQSLLVGALAFGASQAAAHSWYDYDCCSDRDCKPISKDDVKATDNGWRILATNEVIPYTSVRRSPDGRFHRCTKAFDPASTVKWDVTICLYVPDQGS